MTRRSRGKGLLTGPGRVISGNPMSATRCPVCLGPLGQGKKICSPRCRLLSWAAHELLKAYRAGRADGLRVIVDELAKVKR